MNTKQVLLISSLLMLGGLTSCQGSYEKVATAPAASIVADQLGDLHNCTTWGQVTTGGQPSAEVLKLAAESGYTRVINLRTEPEMGSLSFDEKALCEELGMEYLWRPVMWSQMSDEDYDGILADLETSHDGMTLLHCASANRTSLFVALERVLHDGVSKEAALADAKVAGMKPSTLPVFEQQLTRLQAH